MTKIPAKRKSFAEKEWADRIAALDELAKAAIPDELDAITNVVLAYRPKPKTKAAKKRVRKAKKVSELPRRG
jgi:hypothetical protein